MFFTQLYRTPFECKSNLIQRKKAVMTSINFRYSYLFRSNESQVIVYKKVVRNCPNIKMLKQRLSFSIFSNSWYFFFLLLNTKCCLTPSLPECLMVFCKWTLTLQTKSYDVTIQMKALCLYFHMMLFVFQNFRKRNLASWLKFSFGHIWQWKG